MRSGDSDTEAASGGTTGRVRDIERRLASLAAEMDSLVRELGEVADELDLRPSSEGMLSTPPESVSRADAPVIEAPGGTAGAPGERKGEA